MLHFACTIKFCNEIVANAVAERVGGVDSYSLLLASVKSSLRVFFSTEHQVMQDSVSDY